MKKIELGGTGKQISQLALGTMLMGSVMGKEESFAILDDYAGKGGDFLDTANCYAWWVGTGESCGDESEKILGEWMEARGCRKEMFLATKVSARLRDHMAIRNPDGIPRWEEIPRHFEGASAETVIKGVEDSLKRLRTDTIDLLYIHVDDRNTELEETLSALNSLVEKGTVKHIGYSNVQTWRLEKIFNLCRQNNWVEPVAVQSEYSYVNPANYGEAGIGSHVKGEFFDWLKSREKTVSLAAYSPLLKGIYGNKDKRQALLEQPNYDTAETRRRLAKIDEVSERLNVNPNALVLAWMAARKEGIFPILGFSKRSQYDENIKAMEIDLDDIIFGELDV